VTPEAQQKMLAAFDELGIVREQIEAFIGRRLDAIRTAQMARLRRIYRSIKDGLSEPEDWFDPLRKPEAQPEKPTDIRDRVKEAAKAAAENGGAA
jgi:hypothetical protein